MSALQIGTPGSVSESACSSPLHGVTGYSYLPNPYSIYTGQPSLVPAISMPEDPSQASNATEEQHYQAYQTHMAK